MHCRSDGLGDVSRIGAAARSGSPATEFPSFGEGFKALSRCSGKRFEGQAMDRVRHVDAEKTRLAR
jgi:hypothetical protein